MPTDRTQLYGIVGIVVGLICCGPLGIVFGALSVRDAKRFGNSPVLGWIAIGASAIGMVLNVVLTRTGVYPGIDL